MQTRAPYLPDNWFYSFDSPGPNVMRGIKYVQYRDFLVDYGAAKSPLEIEDFDLERDPLR